MPRSRLFPWLTSPFSITLDAAALAKRGGSDLLRGLNSAKNQPSDATLGLFKKAGKFNLSRECFLGAHEYGRVLCGLDRPGQPSRF